jgi:hypothetical protein
VAWLIDLASGARIDVTWPAGYTATFDAAGIHVLGGDGQLATSEGDVVLGGCDVGDPTGVLLERPFPGYRLTCGPLDVASCASKASGVADDGGWPAHRIAELRFTSANGAYVVLYADGSQKSGVARP